ncbi:hypothetical protein [Marmoricola sp. RAF53]|uniref:hypothetical protein n=1 Tax=Marmoricola sp. RAF53 TaxID=3233059 RepID=UPI003F9778E7
MNASDDYCELCDLPLSTCIHGRPPAPPPEKATRAASAPKARTRSTAPARTAATTSRPALPGRWTKPEAFKPLIVAVLEEAGGELDADDVFLELEILTEGKLLPGDGELTPEGELRWRYAARRARMALISEGLMTKAGPGIWKLA